MSNCYADWGLITAAGEAYDSGRGADRERLMTADGGLITAAGKLITGAGKACDSGRERLMTADGGLITAAGEAYDSGREAHYWGGKGL